MPPVIPNFEPSRIIAGDTVKFTKSIAEYSVADGWTLKYSLRGEIAIDATMNVSGETRTVTFPKTPNGTDSLKAGRYVLAGWVEGSGAYAGEQYEIYRGVVEVLASVEAAIAGDLQSQDEIVLARIEAEIKARIDGTGSAHESYAVGGRTLSKIPIRELTSLAGVYRYRVWKARNPNASNPSQKVRFSAVG